MPSDTSTPKSPAQEAREIGRALKLLRTRRGLTQDQAAEALQVTRTAWQNYESGRSVVMRTDMQQKLSAALGANRNELLACLREVQEGPSHSASGAAETGAVYSGPGRLQAVFPTADGQVIISYPEAWTAKGRRQLKAYLEAFLEDAD
jgi:transcriptional regulator with XRE-family HTH domain